MLRASVIRARAADVCQLVRDGVAVLGLQSAEDGAVQHGDARLQRSEARLGGWLAGAAPRVLPRERRAADQDGPLCGVGQRLQLGLQAVERNGAIAYLLHSQ